MDRFSTNNFSRSNYGYSSYGSRFNNRRKSNKPGTKLNHNLFVKKASDTAAQPEFISTLRFEDLAIIDILKKNIADHGYTVPTAIQEKTIPHILAGRDIIGIANTGTGKTAAFLVTLINKAYLDRNQRVLIVVPTRELAIQISDEFRFFAQETGLHVAATVGGSNIRHQREKLKIKPNFVIGTPGRLKDLIGRGDINLSLFQNVVLDEVDRMVDIGFIRDIKYIISLLPKTRQSLFFSATVDSKTQDILRSFVTDPITVTIKQQDTAENIDQDIVKITNGKSKVDILHDLLNQPGFDKIIIFGRTKWGMNKLSHALKERGINTAIIHGNKSQSQRQRALQDFKMDRLKILIATDVASRGLDIDDVTHVINYDAPTTYDDYVHRIGRTGRAGKRGIALTFVE